MTDNSAPGIYTQPDGDADDVLGHKTADKASSKLNQNDSLLDQHDDDVEGHMQKRDLAPGMRTAVDDEDDVQGHRNC